MLNGATSSRLDCRVSLPRMTDFLTHVTRSKECSLDRGYPRVSQPVILSFINEFVTNKH